MSHHAGEAGAEVSRVGLVGFGRFGRALAELADSAGLSVRAFDVEAPPPDGWRAASLAELAAASDAVILAVPVPRMREALAALRPHLTARHLVLDVGSVKTGPIAAMDELLGDAVPWAGTHPLFGPTSLSLGERPLRVVVCPNRRHPSAAARATRLFERLGCVVVERDPDEHDREMAQSHALAYFVAKGTLEAGLQLDGDLAPPSAQAIARTVRSVRSDAGHLFAALHRENPYAADARRRFLAALHEADESLLTDPEGTPAASDAALSIPALAAPSPELAEVRDLIDTLDQEIVSLLVRRAGLARRAAEAKAGLGRGVRDPERERLLLERRREWAHSLGLDAEQVEDIFQAILRFSRRLQREEKGGR